MDEEGKVNLHDRLLDLATLTYVLKMALSNMEQPVNDTTPYAYVANVIEKSLTNLRESL